MSSIKIDVLNNMIKAFEKIPTIKVGILGKNNIRTPGKRDFLNEGPKTNAEIGVEHEFGVDGMPQRSFLRVPLADHLEKQMEASGLQDESVLKDIKDTASLVTFCKKIALVAEEVVQGAFATGGYGKWRPSVMRFKENKQTLVETQQLRNSISSEVKES